MEWNTANKLTMLRVILIPVYLVVWYLNLKYSALLALAVFVIASVTDFLDGYVARHYNQITDFGKFMDPLADKLLVVSAMLWFIQSGQMPAWAVLIVVAREFAVSGLRLIAVDNGRVIAAAWSGKVKTFSTMVCLCLMHLPIPEILVQVCVWVIVITTVYSGIEYFWKNKDVMK